MDQGVLVPPARAIPSSPVSLPVPSPAVTVLLICLVLMFSLLSGQPGLCDAVLSFPSALLQEFGWLGVFVQVPGTGRYLLCAARVCRGRASSKCPVLGGSSDSSGSCFLSGMYFLGMTQELLHGMQEKLPIFVLIAAGLLDLSGASRSERDASDVLALGFPGGAQPRAESSPVPSQGFPGTEDDLDGVTFHFQSPAADPTKETTADSSPAATGRAANRTALLPGGLAGSLEVSEPLHTETAASKPQGGHAWPGQLLGSSSIPVSTQGSQAATALEQPGSSLQRPGDIPGAGPSPAAGLPQPPPSAGPHQDSPQFTAVPSLSVLMEVTSSKTSPLTSTVRFHPPGTGTASSPSPSRAGVALGGAGLGWSPPGMHTTPQAQPGSRAALTPARPERTQGMDAGVTAPAVPPQPAPGGLAAAYSSTTHARDTQLSSVLPLKEETTGSKGRNSTAAVTDGSGHPAQLPPLQTLPPVHSSSFLMGSPVPGGLIPSPTQGPVGTTGGQQPLALHRALNCTKPAAQESNRSSQGITVVALQGDADHGMVTSKPGKSLSPESPRASATSSSLSPSGISTLKLSQTTKEQKEVTSAPSPGMFAFGNADLQPWDSVQEGLQPPGASFPAGLQPMGIPSSAERLHTTTTSPPAPGSGSRGVPAHPVPREAFAVTLQVSTGEDSKRRKGLPQQTAGSGSAPASPVPSPSGARESRTQAGPWHSPAPAAPQSQHSDSPAAPAPAPPRAGGSQPSSATAHPAPGVPSVPSEVPAQLAQALVQQFRRALDAATRNLSSGRGDPLSISSAPKLSFLFRSTDGMICLQPLQESPLPRTFPNASVGGLVSVQQILAASNSSALDLADLPHLSPSSLVLVRPVFILLPMDRADSPFPQGEGDHRTAHLGTSVGTPESSHGRTSSSYPTGKSETTLSTPLSTVSNQQAERAKATPQPTDPSYRTTTGMGQAATSAPGPLLDPGMGMSSTGQDLHLHRTPEEMQIPAPPSQEAKDTDLLLLSRMLEEPGTSPGAPSVLPMQQSPHTSPRVSLTTEKPHFVTPLLPAKGIPDFPVPAQPVPSSTGAAGRAQHGGTLQTAPPGQGSGTTPSSAPAPCVGCVTPHSAAATKHPLKGLTSTKPLQATSQGLPRTTLLLLLPSVVPSTSSASPVLPAGNGHGEAALGSTAPSGGVPVPATAAQTHSTSVQPDLPQHLEFTPKPFVRTEGPTAAPVQAPSSTEIQRSSAAHPPSPAPAHEPLLAALEGDQALQAPAELFPWASEGETPKPTEPSTRAGKAGPGKSLGVSVSLSAPVNTQTHTHPPAALGKELGLSTAQPSVPTGSALQTQPRGTQGTPQAPPAVTALSAAQGAQTTSKKGLHLPPPAPQPDPSVGLPRVNTPAVGKGEGEAKGDAAPTSHLPTQAPLSASPRHPLEKELLEDTMDGHSSPGSALSATGPPPTAALAVSADRPGNKVTSHSAAFQRAAGSDAEMLPARDLIQLLPSPESPSRPAGSPVALPARGDSLPAVAGTDSSQGLLLNTEAEEMGRTEEEVTDGAAQGLVTVVTLLDAQPSPPGDSQHRRGLQPELAVLDGLAVLRDDACGSGNYTVQLSLSPAADTAPEPHGPPAPSPETFLALVAVQDNLSQPLVQPLLQIHSCCVTPSASPGAPGAQCCLFRRLPFECRHIQLLQSSRSRAASFTIQLFQMLNHSVAYLHCELTLCLHGQAGCEQDCLESVEPVLQPSDRNSHGNLHNLISFGPVWRMKDRFLYKPVEGPGSAVLLPVLLGSLTGFAVLGSAFISLWLHHRQKSKPLHYPPFGDIPGL
ncbi:proline-rich protein 36-like isoform X2 [Neopelma chrysocephalum]|uniref:proline-rich protein 36-like isoform X2 n=1 Tax=Neopelma chrysocephalum TaxID=114329 RepID=UPI000FCCFE78|nr:proline-rich protein 36-like isoform X2 [Neopelma chrysocephalum]